MKVLLDTHCWLWWIAEPQRLGVEAHAIFTDSANELLLSVASLWEISIKYGIGKLSLPEAPELFVPPRLRRDRITLLPIEPEHALRVCVLPTHHKDPFDRMLITQAQHQRLPIMTADPLFARYEISLIQAET